MHWDWKGVLQPIGLFVNSDMTVKNVFALLKENESEVGFVLEDEEIIGYVTTTSLLDQLMEEGDPNRRIQPEKDFLFVREEDAAKHIHNCSLVIGADIFQQPTGYVFMDRLDQYLSEVQLKSFNDALNSAEMGIVTMNPSFQVIFMNEKAEQILGMKKSIIQGRDYRRLIRMDTSFDEVLRGQKWFGIENTFNFKVISGQFSPIYENGKITGIIHNFYLKDQLEEAVHEIDFVREMNEDLQAIYSLSNEQILVTDHNGTITRVAGAYFNNFWGDIEHDELIGMNAADLESSGIFQPNIIAACMKKNSRVMLTQKGKNGTVLSTATPVMEDGKIKRIIVLSKDVSTDDKSFARAEDATEFHNETVIYRSAEMSMLMDEVKSVAPLDSTVLVTGESGVGKEVVARSIHQLSSRSSGSFVAINCGAIPEHLIESELFGHEKGAFTGADSKRVGLFEQGHEGTVFLDEVSELPFAMQVKLLRVLQEREVIRVGSTVPIKINVRVIAATNKNLRQMVQKNQFREDLFYRLHVVPIQIPALRNRKDDISPLAVSFLEELNDRNGYEKKISTNALNLLESYQWPGNIRELRNVIERLIVISREDEISEKDVYRVLWETDSKEQGFLTIKGIIPLKKAVEETEKQLIELAVEKYGTATDAAKALETSISTVSRRMKRFNDERMPGGASHDLLL
ncbi:sigma 54-interacting transcriptional regulator [Siminovitchia acidinfaciens]|nr:sigma 54-interacting transcriptional regulator [Siminovitchia acidinfaciens]